MYTKDDLNNILKILNNNLNVYQEEIKALQQSIEDTVAILKDNSIPINSNIFNDILTGGIINIDSLENQIVQIDIHEDYYITTDEKGNFYINYPGNSKEVKEIPSDVLGTLFEKNGAVKAINGSYGNGHNVTRKDEIEGWYLFKKDGHSYEYNVITNEIIVDFSPARTPNNRGKFRCKMFVTPDTDYDEITNTITILGGQGILDETKPVYNDSNPKRTIMTGVNANKNSLIIIPYGNAYGGDGANMAPGVISATMVGNFVSGGNDKKVTNSVIGFSLGGQAAYEATAKDNNPYDTAVIINSAMEVKDGKPRGGGSFENMKKTKFIIMQAKNDETFGDWVLSTTKKLVNEGIPKENIEIYTNYRRLYDLGISLLPNENVHNVEGEISDPGSWANHGGGIGIMKTSGILNYLS